MLEIWEIPEAAIDMKNSSKRWTFKTHSKELLLYQNGSFLVQICIFEKKNIKKTQTQIPFSEVFANEREIEKKNFNSRSTHSQLRKNCCKWPIMFKVDFSQLMY